MADEVTDYEKTLNQQNIDRAYQPPQYTHQSSIIHLTNPADDLYKFELFLRSLHKKADGTIIKVGDPLLNEKGINAIMSAVESVVHQTNTLSNLSEEDIIYMHDTLKDDIIIDLMVNGVEYTVKRKNRELILGNALRFAYGFMKRAFEEGDRKFWRGTTQEIKHTTEHQRSGSQGMSLNPFNRFRK